MQTHRGPSIAYGTWKFDEADPENADKRRREVRAKVGLHPPYDILFRRPQKGSRRPSGTANSGLTEH